MLGSKAMCSEAITDTTVTKRCIKQFRKLRSKYNENYKKTKY